MVTSISNFKPFKPNFEGKRKLYDTNIYTFDIETTSYYKLNGQIYPAVEYINLTKSEQEQCEFFSNMYVWQFGINDTIYYGRTWEELIDFFEKLKQISPYKKYVFVHNLAFEFQFLRGVFNFSNVMARATHKVMRAELEKYNIEFRCTYYMTNVKLAYLPELYNLKTKKLVGDLDYTLLRHSNTPLTQEELNYCENDCLIIYEYIQKELEVYKTLKDLPLTNTGKVRKELHELIDYDYNYKNKTIKATNTDPHVFMLLCKAFAGGYTHANWTLADEILKDVDSWDFTSSYPYVMCAFKYPMTKFKPCKIRDIKQMSSSMAYLIRIRFYNIKCKYFNTFISMSKCIEISGASYDNGRVISAKELEIVLTDVDLKFIIKTHKFDYYDIKESYYSLYDYLPTQLINFILDKYVAKTKYKNVEGKEVAYNIEKGKFNAIYGMCVTNLIKNDVNYDNIKGWSETELTNQQIEKMLIDIEKRGFLSFAWGCWVTSWARNNLQECIIQNDSFCAYCDTDSSKLIKGYDKTVIDNYNIALEKRLKEISQKLSIPFEKFAPKDVFGEPHLIGVFDLDGHYEEFITQGAKKYCYTKIKKLKKVKDTDKIIKKIDNDNVKVLNITLAGTPKKGVHALQSIEDFKDNFVFDYKYTNKLLLGYVDEQAENIMIDYLGNTYQVSDKTGICLLPTTYTLDKSVEYAELVSDSSSKRAVYKE